MDLAILEGGALEIMRVGLTVKMPLDAVVVEQLPGRDPRGHCDRARELDFVRA